jgi:hypothetical protein
MKTCTFIICFLLSAIASFAAAPAGGYAGHSANIVAAAHSATVSANICLEAEDFEGSGPVTDDPNASNGKTRGDKDNWDHYVDYDVQNVMAGVYKITIRYYAEGDASVDVSVNGAMIAPAVTLPATNSWNIVWAERTIELYLQEGANKIRVQGKSGYSVRQDKICLIQSNEPGEPASCNFAIFPRVSSPQVSPGQPITFDSNCSGTDCEGVTFSWSRYGLDTTGTKITINAPNEPGSYLYLLTATKEGCVTKTSNVHFVVDDTPTCDFMPSAFAPNYKPSCATQASFHVECMGLDCYAATYKWSGNGVDLAGSSVVVPVPATNGTFNYTLTASKNGCPDKISTHTLTVTDCPATPGEPFSVCVEAENSNGNGPVTEDPNASNGKTRGAEGDWNHYVDYQVNGVKITGLHQLTLRYYATGTGAVKVDVNGAVAVPMVSLPATNSWNIVWAEKTITVNLIEGNNTVRIAGLAGYSPVRQDKICVTGSGGIGNPPTCGFELTPYTPNSTAWCGQPTYAFVNCSGPDCASVSYQWTGNGLNLPGRIINFDAPSTNGVYNYTVTATKNACPPKTASITITVANCQVISEPFTACVEAEHSSGSGPVSNDPNASNGQTRGDQDSVGHYVDYAINDVPEPGTYKVRLRYYAAENAVVSIDVNAVPFSTATVLPASHSWNIVWREETFDIPLTAGNNYIRFQGISGGSCRQDKVCVLGLSQNARMAAPELIGMQSDASPLQAFPNPASGEFKATFNLKKGETGTISVTDVRGNVWHTRNVKGKGAHQEHITLGNAPAGIYLLQVRKPDSIETKKILLTR